MANDVIRVQNVSKSFRVHSGKNMTLKDKILYAGRARYREFVALKDVSITIPKGSTTGLLGVNGSGKSTLLKLISRILYPDQGTIEVNGRVSSLLELGAGFHPDFTGVENIYLNGALLGLSKKEIKAKIDEIIDFSELGDFISEPIRNYSSGMYMRLAFSVAVAVDPDILLIDEILAVGDAAFQAKCLNHIKKLQQMNKTIVIVTHDTGIVERFCDTAVWLRDSRIAYIGEPEKCTQIYLDAVFRQAHEGNNMSFDRSEAPVAAEEKSPQTMESSPPSSRLIEKVSVSVAGFETDAVMAGDQATIAIQLNAFKEIKDTYLEIQLYNQQHRMVFETNSFKGHIKKIDVEPGMKKNVSIDFPNLTLEVGEYFINTRLVSNENEPVEFYEKSCSFQVIPNAKENGLMMIPHEWNETELVVE